MDLVIVNTIVNIVDAALVLYCLITIFNMKVINYRKAIIVLILLLTSLVLVNQVYSQERFLRLTTILALTTVSFLFIFSQSIYRILIYNVFILIQIGICEIIIISLISIILRITPTSMVNLDTYVILVTIISRVGFILYGRELLYKVNINNHTNHKAIITICAFNILVIIITLVLFNNIRMVGIVEYIYLSGMALGTVICSWTIYSMIQKMEKESYEEAILRVKEDEFRKEDFYLKSMNDVLESIRSERHDLNNYLSTLYGLIYLENYREAMDYITRINKRMNNMQKIIETNNPVITSLLSVKKNKAIENKIEMKINIDLPEELLFDYIDLSIIIGNLLDNAIEACMLVGPNLKKEIELFIAEEDNNLIIGIVNSKSSSVRVNIGNILERFTTKEDKLNHGLGLKNVGYVVNKYKGSMDIDDLGNQFSVRISLPREKQFNQVNMITPSTT